MSDLAAFLLARIAEDEASLHGSDCQSLGLHIITTQAAERWLAECEAKRRIVQICAAADDCGDHMNQDDLLSALALPYAEHPGFREEWRMWVDPVDVDESIELAQHRDAPGDEF